MQDNKLPLNELEQETSELLPDFTDIDEVRKAFIANEILNRKY